MINVFLSLGLIAFIGSMLRYIIPGIEVESFRQSINKMVMFILLPSLIFSVFYRGTVGPELYVIPLAALAGLVTTLIFATLIFRFAPLPDAVKGALVLGSSFSNVTYLGLPVLMGVFSDIPDKIAVVSILYEVTITPMLLSMGIVIAIYFGAKSHFKASDYVKKILSLPPLWALGIVLLVRVLDVEVPTFLLDALNTLGVTAAGLMILSLGMSLRFRKPVHLKPIVVAVLIQLAFIPIVVYQIGKALSMNQPYFEATVIEASMPTQLLTLVVAEEFNLDMEVLAQIILLTTAFSVVSVPLIRYLLFP